MFCPCLCLPAQVRTSVLSAKADPNPVFIPTQVCCSEMQGFDHMDKLHYLSTQVRCSEMQGFDHMDKLHYLSTQVCCSSSKTLYVF